VNAVSAQIQQVFVNLLSNALDASAEQGNITVGCRTVGSAVEAYVQDNGVGIPPELRGKVFEPFFTTKEVGSGTGLGLFVCHKIVTAHNGEIEIDSENGTGTIVRVRLPAVATARQTQEPRVAGPKGEG
jgi:signal transduction histidine kinase